MYSFKKVPEIQTARACFLNYFKRINIQKLDLGATASNISLSFAKSNHSSILSSMFGVFFHYFGA